MIATTNTFGQPDIHFKAQVYIFTFLHICASEASCLSLTQANLGLKSRSHTQNVSPPNANRSSPFTLEELREWPTRMVFSIAAAATKSNFAPCCKRNQGAYLGSTLANGTTITIMMIIGHKSRSQIKSGPILAADLSLGARNSLECDYSNYLHYSPIEVWCELVADYCLLREARLVSIRLLNLLVGVIPRRD